MRSIITITLSLAILLQSAGKLIVIVDFGLNQEYIAKNLCENKAKPMMHCNGKCHLRKQLQKEDKKDNSPNSLREKHEVQLFSGLQKLNFSSFPTELDKSSTPYLFNSPEAFCPGIFRPPGLI
ncbi:MAG: hypothetical protein ACJ77K_00055 [Bacteroidia bacterium]